MRLALACLVFIFGIGMFSAELYLRLGRVEAKIAGLLDRLAALEGRRTQAEARIDARIDALRLRVVTQQSSGSCGSNVIGEANAVKIDCGGGEK